MCADIGAAAAETHETVQQPVCKDKASGGGGLK